MKTIIDDKKIDGVWCIVKSEGKKSGSPNIMKYVRLFRNKKGIEFSGKVHEQILPSLTKLNYRLKKSNIVINHLGYDISKDELKKKASRNLEILLEQYSHMKDNYTAFQIAQSYGILKNKSEAAKYFRIFVDDERFIADYRAIGYRFLAGIELDNNNTAEALRLINLGIAVSNTQPLLYMIAAQIHLKMGNPKEAVLFCRKAFEENNKLLQNEIAANYDIMITEELVLYYGIDFAVKANDIDSFNFYFQKLKVLKEKEHDKNGLTELNFIKKLLGNETISVNESTGFIAVVNENNIDLFITLFNNYKLPVDKLEMIRLLIDKFKDNIKLKNIFGISLMENSQYESAAEVFKDAVKINPKEPSSYFYLISAYINMGKLESIGELISKAEKEFEGIREVTSRLDLLKEKLKQFSCR